MNSVVFVGDYYCFAFSRPTNVVPTDFLALDSRYALGSGVEGMGQGLL